MASALIVDDDTDFTRMMAALVSHQGFSATTAASLHGARKQMAKVKPDLLFLDLYLPDGDGLSLLEDRDLLDSTDIVMMTGHASLETSIRALRQGATDYLVKPVSVAQLQGVLARVSKQSLPLHGDTDEQWRRTGRFGQMMGRSGRMQLIYEQILLAASSSIPVLISGATGTGKDLAARAIHDRGLRRSAPFVAVSCSTLASSMLGAGPESASSDAPGLFAQAAGGTLFLDEICEMPLPVQSQVLRALDTEGHGNHNVRIVSATNRDPAEAVAAGALRADLFYRLCAFPIEMPALCERLEDLPLLAGFLLRQIGEREGVVKRLHPNALQRLSQHRWPGNVRELRNTLQQAYAMTAEQEIRHIWLPVGGPSRLSHVRLLESPGAPAGTLMEIERRAVLSEFQRCGHHRERTAAALGISLKTLYNRLKLYGY